MNSNKRLIYEHDFSDTKDNYYNDFDCNIYEYGVFEDLSYEPTKDDIIKLVKQVLDGSRQD